MLDSGLYHVICGILNEFLSANFGGRKCPDHDSVVGQKPSVILLYAYQRLFIPVCFKYNHSDLHPDVLEHPNKDLTIFLDFVCFVLLNLLQNCIL